MAAEQSRHPRAVIGLACRKVPLLPIGVALIVLTLVILGFVLASQMDAQIRAKLTAQASTGAEATAEHVGRILDDAQRTLLTIAGLIRSQPERHPERDTVLVTVAEQLNLDQQQTAGLAVIDAQGQAILLDREFMGQRFDVSMRPYFPIAQRSAVDSFSYGPPTQNINTGSTNIPIMLKIEHADEEWILATAFAIDRLSAYLQRIAPGSDGIAAVIQRGDAIEPARFAALVGPDEKAVADALLAAFTANGPLIRAKLGVTDYTLSTSEIERTPFAVVTAFSDTEVDAAFQQQLRAASVLYGSTLFLLVLAALALLLFIGRSIQAVNRLRASEQHFRDLVEGSLQGIWVHQNYRLVFANQASARMLGYDSIEEFLALPSVEVLIAPEDRVRLREYNETRLQGKSVPITYQFKALCKDGSQRVLLNAVRRIEWNDAPAIQCALVDVTEAHELSERLAYEARHDELTGLMNRRAFLERLRRTITTKPAIGHAHVLCVLDLDQFKVVNDSCGHAAGDELLRRLGTLFRSKIRSTDILARLGGDEFAALLEHCPLTQIARVATVLLETMEDYRFVWDDYSFKIGLSIGVVPIKSPVQEDPIRLLTQADNACYVAKERGRNRFHIYAEDDAAVTQRTGEMRWVASCDAALAENRFFFVAQPIANLNGQAAGRHFELLLRMEADDGSIVSPGVFLAAAERYNIATRIDRWVIDNALAWLAKTPNLLDSIYLCNINLSAQTLADEPLCAYFKQAIINSAVPGAKLCFEITETAAMIDVVAAMTFISELRELGCRFALDDFGSGLSSFGYLKTMPVDFLKIDGQFVRDISRDPVDLAVVRSINEIGHEMGKLTVAEFVEDKRILDLLIAMGVDFAQGYHVGRPQRVDLQNGDMQALDNVLNSFVNPVAGKAASL